MNTRRKRRSYLPTAALLLLLVGASHPWAAPATNPAFRPGVLPQTWPHGERGCTGLPDFYVHKYNDDLYILRQSGCSNYEKPFLFLIFGRERVLLLDTGAGGVDVAGAVKKIIAARAGGRGPNPSTLVVAHTHAHGDHTAGDDQLRTNFPGATIVEHAPKAVQTFFRIKRWPDEVAQYDLGGRILDVIPIPGHEASSIALYDRQTAILFTGDTLYPGRLYVEAPVDFVQSIRRLVAFTGDKPVAQVLGAHVENMRAPYLDYPMGTKFQPDEHALELGRAHLLELNDALLGMKGRVVNRVMRDFTIWPLGGPR
jgi:hydroxyacylglutathione hydrolase